MTTDTDALALLAEALRGINEPIVGHGSLLSVEEAAAVIAATPSGARLLAALRTAEALSRAAAEHDVIEIRMFPSTGHGSVHVKLWGFVPGTTYPIDGSGPTLSDAVAAALGSERDR